MNQTNCRLILYLICYNTLKLVKRWTSPCFCYLCPFLTVGCHEGEIHWAHFFLYLGFTGLNRIFFVYFTVFFVVNSYFVVPKPTGKMNTTLSPVTLLPLQKNGQGTFSFFFPLLEAPEMYLLDMKELATLQLCALYWVHFSSCSLHSDAKHIEFSCDEISKVK